LHRLPAIVMVLKTSICCRAMTTNLDPQDRADLARFLREAIEADRFPLSPRVLLAKVDPAPGIHHGLVRSI
jgi:hypothetical protein